MSEAWRWVWFTTADGLPSDLVYQVRESSTGRIWAATSAGVAWYDGYRWQPAQGLPAERPNSFEPDQEGGLLVVVGHRLLRGSHDSPFQELSLSLPGGANPAIEDAIPLARNQILYLSEGFLYLREGRGVSPFPLPPDVPPGGGLALWRTRAGNNWLQTARGIHRWSGSSWELKFGGASGPLHARSIVENSRGDGFARIYWPPEARGVWEWSGGDQPSRQRPLEGHHSVQDIAPSGDAIMAVGWGDVMVRAQGVWTTLTRSPEPLAESHDLRFQSNGDLWVGTNRGLFLYRSNLKRWSHWGSLSEGHRRSANEIVRARDGSIWVATAGGLEVRGPTGEPRLITQILERPVHTVTGLAEDESGHIWISSGESFTGSYRWDGASWRHFGAAEGLPEGSIHKIRKDRRGRLWFLFLTEGPPGSPEITGGAGAYVREEGRFTRWGPEQGLPGGRVYSFDEGEDGALWFGTASGLARWKAGAWTYWSTQNGLRGDVIFALAVDRQNRAWFGDRGNGLGVIEGDRSRYLTMADGLIDDRVWDLRTDPSGRLWIATAGGLGAYENGIWARFRGAHGVGNPILWPVLPLEDRVYIGSQAGVSILHLAEASAPPPRLELQKPHVEKDSVLIRWRAFPFQGELPSRQVETRTRLDGAPWSPWSTEREIAHLSLSPGRHSFEAQAKGLFGNFDEEGARVEFQIEYPLYRQPGFYLPVGGSLLVALLLLALFQAERRERRRTLHQSERRYRGLFENAQDAIATLNLRGEFTSLNRAGEDLTGFSASELAGQNISRLLAPEMVKEIRSEVLARALAGEVVHLQLELVHRERRRIPVELSARLIPQTEGPRKELQIIARDITERERAAEAREALEEQVRQSLKRESLEVLAGGIAHRFNNLLTSILGNTESARRQVPAEWPVQSSLKQISETVQDAAQLAGQMLAYTGEGGFTRSPLDLTQVVEESEGLLRRLVGEDAELRIELHPDLPLVNGDFARVRQALRNLAANALESLQDEPRHIFIRTGLLLVGPGEDSGDHLELPVEEGEYVYLEVVDTGCGMSAETRTRVFDPFFTTKFPGRGLGMAAVLGIMRGHKGSIRLESRPGSGTSCRLLFPRSDRPAAAA